MSYNSKHRIVHPRMDWCEVIIRISAADNTPEHVEQYGDVATMVLETGLCSAQFYATPEALRALAGSLTNAAQAIEMSQRPNDGDGRGLSALESDGERRDAVRSAGFVGNAP